MLTPGLGSAVARDHQPANQDGLGQREQREVCERIAGETGDGGQCCANDEEQGSRTKGEGGTAFLPCHDRENQELLFLSYSQ